MCVRGPLNTPGALRRVGTCRNDKIEKKHCNILAKNVEKFKYIRLMLQGQDEGGYVVRDETIVEYRGDYVYAAMYGKNNYELSLELWRYAKNIAVSKFSERTIRLKNFRRWTLMITSKYWKLSG